MHSTEAKPLAFDELLSRCLGELEFARKILRSFLKDSGPILDEIETSINDESFERAAKAAHRLKGTASLMAAKPLLSCLLKIEEQLRSEKAPEAKKMQELLVEARQQFKQVKFYVETHLL